MQHDGRAVQGNYKSTHFRRESPNDAQVFEEHIASENTFQHTWAFDLSKVPDQWLVIAADRINGGDARFSIPADSARVVLITPAGGEMRSEGQRTLIDDVVVRYTK